MVKTTKILKQALFLVFMIFSFNSAVTAQEHSVSVITHRDVPQEQLTKEDIRLIFLGKRMRWSNQAPITFVLSKDPESLEPFMREIMGKTQGQFTNYWKKMLFTGKGMMPRFLETDKEVIQYVKIHPNACGFVSKKNLPEDVRILY